LFCIVACGSGSDEELPVGGFEQKEFAAELFDDALAESAVAQVSAARMVTIPARCRGFWIMVVFPG